MDETKRVEEYLKGLLSVMVNRAEKEVDAVMPGYTHLQVRQALSRGREANTLTFLPLRFALYCFLL